MDASVPVSPVEPVVGFPQPPLCAATGSNAVQPGEQVVAALLDGSKVVGALETFDTASGELAVYDSNRQESVTVPFDRLKTVSLPTPRQWIRAEPESGERDGLTMSAERQDFEVRFKDGDVLAGDTVGFRSDRSGIYLFPCQNANQYIHTFVPHAVIEEQRIGPRLGEMLVGDELVSERAVGSALQEQERNRSRPLGEYLRSHAVVTAMELERALKQQKSAPNLRLGEILVSEQLISEEQLHQALAAQKNNRSKPLGEILVDQGLLSPAQIQKSLAKKLCIPFVDLSKFDIDPNAVQRVPETLVRRHTVLPLYDYEGKLVVAVENPMDWEPLDAVAFRTNMTVEPVMAPREEILRTIELVYSSQGLEEMTREALDTGGASADEGGEDEGIEEADNVVVKLVNKIVADAYHQGASDIHIEPDPAGGKTLVRIRKDGDLLHYYDVPERLRKSLVSRLKIMAGLDISEKRRPQDGKIDFRKFSRLKLELRIATLPTVNDREDVVIRLLAAGDPIPLTELGLSESNFEGLSRIIAKPYGLFLVCGPTGSGKTTTLHSVLKELNTPTRKIWTAEDPVEITQKGLRQVQVHPKIGVDFASAMRAFLRADPDVIMVGEMRDRETCAMGVEASLTGHLVLSTLHTNSAPESILRLLDMGMDPFNFADALLGVLAQRLTKRLCPHCKQPYQPDEEELAELQAEYARDVPVPRGRKRSTAKHAQELVEQWRERFGDGQGNLTLYRAEGCDRCDETGYAGRVGIHELLEATDEVRKHILNHGQVTDIRATGLKEGMRTLKQDGIEKILQGVTDIHQVRRVCSR